MEGIIRNEVVIPGIYMLVCAFAGGIEITILTILVHHARKDFKRRVICVMVLITLLIITAAIFFYHSTKISTTLGYIVSIAEDRFATIQLLHETIGYLRDQVSILETLIKFG